MIMAKFEMVIVTRYCLCVRRITQLLKKTMLDVH